MVYMTYLWNIVIVHSYVKFPEGNRIYLQLIPSRHITKHHHAGNPGAVVESDFRVEDWRTIHICQIVGPLTPWSENGGVIPLIAIFTLHFAFALDFQTNPL